MDAALMDMFSTASVISAAQQSGLVRALSAGPKKAAAYAADLGLDARATRLVLDALVALDLARRDGDAYDASDRVKSFSRPWGQAGIPPEGIWNHMPTFLKTGEPFLRMDGAPVDREASYRNTVSALAQLVEGTARELAKKLTFTPARVLDVGCGSGVWSLAIAERSPAVHVTGQDFPAVLEAFKARAASLGLGDRVGTIPGNMHEVTLPKGAFDLVVICNVLRLDTPARAASLVAKLATAVAPGGALLVVDALAAGTPAKERSRTLYALNLALRTQEGRVHSPEEITGWLKAAGLGSVEAIDLGTDDAAPGGMGALIARA